MYMPYTLHIDFDRFTTKLNVVTLTRVESMLSLITARVVNSTVRFDHLYSLQDIGTDIFHQMAACLYLLFGNGMSVTPSLFNILIKINLM